MQAQRIDRIASLARRAAAGLALAALLTGVGATLHPAAAAGPCVAADGLDPDRDGLTCSDEALIYGTDPLLFDSDGDGAGDGYEVANGTNPMRYDLGAEPVDNDGDGLADDDEYLYYGTSPSAWDSDGDGYGDGYEISIGYDPVNPFCTPASIGC